MPLPQSRCTAEDYWNLPEGVRAELIDGELWDLAAPSRTHQRIVHAFDVQLESYVAAHGGNCEVNVAPFAVNLFGDDSTIVEPDVSVVCDPGKLSDRGCEGAPDLVVEVVSPSNPGMDYLSKLALYRDAGVREYWICDPLQRRTLVYAFADGAGDAGAPEAADRSPLSIFPFAAPAASRIFDGFAIDLGAVIARL